MFVTINHLPAEGAEAGAALEARFTARQRLVDRMPGFRGFEILRPVAAPVHGGRPGREYLQVTSWASRAAFDGWVNSPEQRPIRAASHGHLAATDAHAWFTLHESVQAAYAPAWQQAAARAEAPIVTMNVIDVAPGFEGVFEEVFATRAGDVEHEDGFLSLEILRQVAGNWDGPGGEPTATTYLVSTRWASQAAQDAWVAGPEFARAHGQRRLPDGAVVTSGLRAFRIVQPAYGSQPAPVR
jgi:heme-degrading monooxygenase HmoA